MQRRRRAVRDDLQRPGDVGHASSTRFSKTLVLRVRATDDAGNVSGWKSSATRKIVAIQNSNKRIAYTGGLDRCPDAGLVGHGLQLLAQPPATRPPCRSSGRSVLYVGTKTKLSGHVKVYVDGTLVGRYNLHATDDEARQDHRHGWPGARTAQHRIRIVNDDAGKQANLDAFIVLK